MCGAALARGFKEDDSAGGGNVQRIDVTGHRNAEQVIAGAANKIVQASPFASKDNYRIGREVEAVVIPVATLVEADDPEIVFFESFESADKVDDASQAEMLGGSGRGFNGDRTEGSGAALGEEDAVDAGAFGGAQERAQVLGIFDTIEGEDEAGFGTIAGDGEQIFKVEEVALADDGDDALVGCRLGETGEGFAWLGADFDAGLAAEGRDGGQPRVMAAAEALGGDADVIETPGARAQGFFDGVEAVQNLHRLPVYPCWSF